MPPFLLLIVALACNEHPMTPLQVSVEITEEAPVGLDNQIDVLWVIDNSHSMCQEQVALNRQFEGFVEGLLDIGADFHIAVVTTDMSSDPGRLRTAPGSFVASCPAAENPVCPERVGPVLRLEDYADSAGSIDQERLGDDFECIASVGTETGGAAGIERGLDAMRLALESDQALNDTPFRRPEAWLAVIFLTDENDCSHSAEFGLNEPAECEWRRDELTPVSEYETFLRSQGNDSSRIFVAGIIGPDNGLRPDTGDELSPTCNGDLGEAFAGYRYSELVEGFGERGVESSICHESVGQALDRISTVIRRDLGLRCLSRPLQDCSDSAQCGPEAECDATGYCSDAVVVEVMSEGGAGWTALAGPDEEQPQYSLNLAAQCAGGLAVELSSGVADHGDTVRVRYPSRLQ